MAETVRVQEDCSSAPSPATHSFDSGDYECKICFNYFDLDRHIPKLLSCSHTFCQECLGMLHSREGRGWRVSCPVCRQRTPVREHRVQNLPDNTALAQALPLEKYQYYCDISSNAEGQPAAPPGSPQDTRDCCETCKHVAFTTGCVCAIFSFLSMVVLLFLGLIFVHNFNHRASHVGSVCLSVASVLALFTLIITWLTCTLKYRTETEAFTSVM
ncbi:E3 ubiquitin-protein ligase RNF186-like [Cololabis saira]|uniref:E3 ubiquitin-protein ligase RNF186-like n=1 Tax=Cololabis saira TaxID=129043 RepID=UPI002AD390BD|nr:E3 ubiquitin-protein ligase RNF186-like [Cololabis saira]